MALGRKTGGRSAGTPNRRTTELREMRQRLNCSPRGKACSSGSILDERRTEIQHSVRVVYADRLLGSHSNGRLLFSSESTKGTKKSARRISGCRSRCRAGWRAYVRCSTEKPFSGLSWLEQDFFKYDHRSSLLPATASAFALPPPSRCLPKLPSDPWEKVLRRRNP